MPVDDFLLGYFCLPSSRNYLDKLLSKRKLKYGRARAWHAALLLSLLTPAIAVILAGCGVNTPAPTGAVVGRDGKYDYSPSVIQTGDELKFWWCGTAQNPADSNQTSDTILYESINTTTKVTVGPMVVLAETPGTWDAEFTCNPRVVEGMFQNPLGNGTDYTYALYYVATIYGTGTDNSIGVAFSNDGVQWTKHTGPVIRSTSFTQYGAGQPAVLNEDQKSKITLFYEDISDTTRHVKATSADGVNFTVQGSITSNGLTTDTAQPSWGDMGYDPTTGNWYALFNRGRRTLSTTGNVLEYGQYGFALYRISNSSLLSGATPWVFLKQVDTSLTGYEANFIPSLLHDMYGNINVGSFPKIQMYPSISTPAPAWDATPSDAGNSGYPNQWDIGSYLWDPNAAPLALIRYANLQTYDVTTGWVDPNGAFKVDLKLGHLYEAPKNGANLAYYACKNNSTDYFLSLDPGCEGARILGLSGYGYATPPTGIATVPLYLCDAQNVSHFVSHDKNCETRGTGKLLGYALP